MSISWWKTGVMLPDMGGTIHTQSAGQPPRQRYSFSMCLMKDSVAEWWSTMVTLSLCGRRGGKSQAGRGAGAFWGTPFSIEQCFPKGGPRDDVRPCKLILCISLSIISRGESPFHVNTPFNTSFANFSHSLLPPFLFFYFFFSKF